MGEIRPFTEEFANDVAALYFRAMRGKPGLQSEALRKYFCHIFLENPWFAPDIAPLVYLDQGRLVGFLGVIPRTMEFRGRLIRVAVTSQLMVDPGQHRGIPGLELLRYFLRGPQEMSYTDGAADAVSALWTAAGGNIARLYCLNWSRLLRPLETARSLLDRAGGSWGSLKAISGLITKPGDFLLSKLPLGLFRPPASPYSVRVVSAQDLFGCIQEIGWREPLKPAYERRSFGWMMSEVAEAKALGELRMMTVQDPKGVRCGWFAYCAKPGGVAYVLQIGVRRRDQFDPTLLSLIRDAWNAGCSVIKGQAIPSFLTQLTRQHCLFRQPDSCVLIHSRDSDLLNIVRTGDAALSRLDGECWLQFSVEPWT